MTYTLVPDYLARRPGLRQAHLAHARAAVARGALVLGGVLDPPDEAALLFTGDCPEVAERFADTDPYVIHGLVSAWRVREWITVVGESAAYPVP